MMVCALMCVDVCMGEFVCVGMCVCVCLVNIVRTIIKHTFCLRTEIASDEISNMSPDVQLSVTCVCVHYDGVCFNVC